MVTKPKFKFVEEVGSQAHIESIEEGESSRAGTGKLKDDEEAEDNGAREEPDEVNKSRTRAARPARLDILDGVRINNTVETPRSTFRGILKVPKPTELIYNRENLKKAEQMLIEAFSVFYQKLRLLKSYRCARDW